MPTRLPVLLQSRKSARAGLATKIRNNANATACSIPPPESRQVRGRCESTTEGWRIVLKVRGISRDPSRPVNEDGAEIIDIGAGWAGLHEVAQGGKKAGRIVVGEKGGRILAQ